LSVWAGGIEHFGAPLFKSWLKASGDGRPWALSVSPNGKGANGKRNFLGTFPENQKIVKFLKCNPFNLKFKDKNQMEQKFLVTCFGNSGIAEP